MDIFLFPFIHSVTIECAHFLFFEIIVGITFAQITASVARFGYFERILETNFVTKEAQQYYYFLVPIFSKNCLRYFCKKLCYFFQYLVPLNLLAQIWL